MNTPLEKILDFIELYDQQSFVVGFRVQTKSNCDEKYQNYIGGSGWKHWLGCTEDRYLDFGYEPTPYRMIKQIQINPIEERDRGKLMLSQVMNHTEEVCQMLDELKINYEMQHVLICLK